MWSHCWLPDRFEALDSLLYLFDANVLITAKNTYYPIDQIPEYWEWIQFQGSAGNIKLPLTTEVSAPSKKRQNRRIPDVCATLGLNAARRSK